MLGENGVVDTITGKRQAEAVVVENSIRHRTVQIIPEGERNGVAEFQGLNICIGAEHEVVVRPLQTRTKTDGSLQDFQFLKTLGAGKA